MSNILYLTYKENPFVGNKAIIITQVEELLYSIGKEHSITWIAVVNNQFCVPEDIISSYSAKLAAKRVRFIVLKCDIGNIYFGLHKVIKAIKPYLKLVDANIIHCRGYAMTMVANILKRKEKVIFDMRGLYADEQKINRRFPGNLSAYLFWKIIERINIMKSDSIICVTKYFEEFINTKYPGCCSKVKVVYNCVNTERTFYSKEARIEIRRKLALENNYVIVFCGSIKDKWQSFDKIVEVYKQIRLLISNSKLLVLTKDVNILLSDYALEKDEVILLYVDNYEIYKYLSAGDIALLIRDANPVNYVAFPVKFAEYMACGLPAIISKSMKGLSSIIINKGFIYGEYKLNGISKKFDKNICIQFSKEYLDTKVIAQKYNLIYKELTI